MNSGWIKLHRQIIDNNIFRHDRTAWHLFEVLLIISDRKSGKWSGGRFQLSDLCQEKAATIYKALKRLEKAKMVTLESNNKYTTIYICNWNKYQESGNTSEEQQSNNKVTTKEQQSNTLTRSKELRIKNKEVYIELFNFWSTLGGRKLTDNKTSQQAVDMLLKVHTKEEIEFAIRGAVYYQGKQYKPQVMSFKTLYDKWDNLLGHMQTEKKEQQRANNRF